MIALQTTGSQFIPAPDICDELSCTPLTLKRACERHGIAPTKLSQKTWGLTSDDYALLLSRARESGKAKHADKS